jgi:hypothetical protein
MRKCWVGPFYVIAVTCVRTRTSPLMLLACCLLVREA